MDPTEYKLGSCSHCTVPRRAPLGLIVSRLRPDRRQDDAVLATVKVRPGEVGAWGEVSTTADLDGRLRATSVRFCGRGGRMLAAWVEQKNWGTKKKMGPKQRRSEPLTKEAPYKPYARIGPVRICAGALSNERPLYVADCLANRQIC
jgi:hypothetical protein